MDEFVDELKQIIKNLSAEIVSLREENESLWLMLDEIKESDKVLNKTINEYDQEKLIELLLKQKPVGDA
tara:strand:- start:1696 stop:1902 length:207 start_codon:yes stop_codon:yes gene_type:complete